MQLVLANLLLTHASLHALVGNRVHWDSMPQGQPLPGIVMFVVSGVSHYTMQGPNGFEMTRVQFDCRGASAAAARAVAEALRAKLSGYSGIYDGFHFQGCFEQARRTRFEGDVPPPRFIDSRDYTIHWAPA